MTIPGLLHARAADQPDKAAFETPDGRTLTFADWSRRTLSLASGLRALGVAPGDRVLLRYPNADWPDYAVGYCAVQQAGAVAVPVSSRLPAAQLDHILTHSGAVGLLDQTADPHRHDGWTHAPVELDGAEIEFAEHPGLAQILYTSGTTGTPKGVGATHANLLAAYDPTARQRPLSHSRHFLHAFPIGHNIGQTMLVNALTAAPTALVAGEFDADAFAALIERHRVGTVFVVPTMAIDLLGAKAHERHDLSSVVLLGSTGAALMPAVAHELATAFPTATVVNYYTSTEAAPTQTTMVFDADRPTSVGRAAHAGNLLVGDPDTGPCPVGEAGDVWLRTAGESRWYYGDPDASATVFRGGWTRMGDVGYLDADGYLYLVDRESDIIKSGGLKVSTLQVEAALHEHPAVAEAAVLGVDHPSLGKAVAAAVVLRDPCPTDDLKAFLADRLAPHERPLRIVELAELPRNDNGKVVKRLIAEHLTAPEVDRDATDTETALAELWRELFGGAEVGPGADFFALGGDSLKATRLAARITARFAVEVPTTFAFDRPVLAAQAEAVNELTGGSHG
ncbi:AMP-binding protein [Actinokineospora sp. HUAS TT18]|uniref:AMP-binding protein n=1 Tax=Actinokineospora sp. HUAS TT18 TaxID=3447451 RepID=UPI003F5222A0